MRARVVRALWIGGTPVRQAVLGLIWLYRSSLGTFIGGRCRFYPSCSAYAEQAVREWGTVRGLALAGWRILRCSPLSRGGVDYPPRRRESRSEGLVYDSDIHAAASTRGRARGEAWT